MESLRSILDRDLPPTFNTNPTFEQDGEKVQGDDGEDNDDLATLRSKLRRTVDLQSALMVELEATKAALAAQPLIYDSSTLSSPAPLPHPSSTTHSRSQTRDDISPKGLSAAYLLAATAAAAAAASSDDQHRRRYLTSPPTSPSIATTDSLALWTQQQEQQSLLSSQVQRRASDEGGGSSDEDDPSFPRLPPLDQEPAPIPLSSTPIHAQHVSDREVSDLREKVALLTTWRRDAESNLIQLQAELSMAKMDREEALVRADLAEEDKKKLLATAAIASVSLASSSDQSAQPPVSPAAVAGGGVKAATAADESPSSVVSLVNHFESLLGQKGFKGGLGDPEWMGAQLGSAAAMTFMTRKALSGCLGVVSHGDSSIVVSEDIDLEDAMQAMKVRERERERERILGLPFFLPFPPPLILARAP